MIGGGAAGGEGCRGSNGRPVSLRPLRLFQLNQKNMTLSNRCQVFDRFQDTISQHAVKVDFLNRIHKKHPPNRRVVQSGKRKGLKVGNPVSGLSQLGPLGKKHPRLPFAAEGILLLKLIGCSIGKPDLKIPTQGQVKERPDNPLSEICLSGPGGTAFCHR